MKRNQREQKILPLRFWSFPKTWCLYWWIKTFLQEVFCRFLCSLHSYPCKNVLINQYKHHVFGKFQNRRGNIFCSRWFLFIISFLLWSNDQFRLDVSGIVQTNKWIEIWQIEPALRDLLIFCCLIWGFWTVRFQFTLLVLFATVLINFVEFVGFSI
jgi:hypothetical protein